MVRVAIIDDGIGIGIYDIGNIERSIEITSDLIVQDVDKYKILNSSHGTICAAIVKKYYPGAIFTSIKVLSDKSHKGNNEQLVNAIKWCIDNGIRVINLSIGTINYKNFEFIKNIVNRAYNSGLIIVASCSNRDVFTYPASSSNVIGVKKSNISNLKEGEYVFNLYPLDGIEISACSEHMLFKNNNKSRFTRMCNSYATPMITALVCRIIDKHSNITFEEIKQKLYEYAINYSDNGVRVNNYKNIDWINNAAVLNMIKYNSYELPCSNKINMFKEIEAIPLRLFDTLIILNDSKRNFEKIKSIISKVESEQKNIVIIDDEYQDKNYEFKYSNDDIKFWHPSIINHFFEQNLNQKEREVPLILVYDNTKSNLIKIVETLTSKFRSDGYYSIGASTKSIGALYGLEYIPLKSHEDFKEIKDKIEALYKVYNCDILILGMSINKEDISMINEVNTEINPDTIICCLDEFSDEIKAGIEKISINDTLIITPQNDMNFLYKKILNMFLYKNEKI